jgi:hypothetical protein
LATRAKHNSNEWLLAEVERRTAADHINIAGPSLGLSFSGGANESRLDELQWTDKRIQAGMLEFAEFGDAALAE